MDNEPGKFTTDWLLSDRRCPQCGGEVEVRLWESDCGGFEDSQFRCMACNHLWWVDGPDA